MTILVTYIPYFRHGTNYKISAIAAKQWFSLQFVELKKLKYCNNNNNNNSKEECLGQLTMEVNWPNTLNVRQTTAKEA